MITTASGEELLKMHQSYGDRALMPQVAPQHQNLHLVKSLVALIQDSIPNWVRRAVIDQ